MSVIDNSPDSVSSVLKVFGILQALGEQKEIGVTELSQRIMMSKSTVYRFLQTMKTLGYVTQEGKRTSTPSASSCLNWAPKPWSTRI